MSALDDLLLACAHVNAVESEYYMEHRLIADATAELSAARSRITALEGLLRECKPMVLALKRMRNSHHGLESPTCDALLSRLDAALTPDRKDAT